MSNISNISFPSSPRIAAHPLSSDKGSSTSFVPLPTSLSNSQDIRENITGYGKVETVRSSYLARSSPYVANPQAPKIWSPQEWAFLPEARREFLLKEKEEQLQKLKEENGALKGARQTLINQINSLNPASSDLSLLETSTLSSTSSSSDSFYLNSSCSSQAHSPNITFVEMVPDDFSPSSVLSTPLDASPNPITATTPPPQATLQLQTLNEKEQTIKSLTRENQRLQGENQRLQLSYEKAQIAWENTSEKNSSSSSSSLPLAAKEPALLNNLSDSLLYRERLKDWEMPRRCPEFESGNAGAEAAKLKKFSDAGGSQNLRQSDAGRTDSSITSGISSNSSTEPEDLISPVSTQPKRPAFVERGLINSSAIAAQYKPHPNSPHMLYAAKVAAIVAKELLQDASIRYENYNGIIPNKFAIITNVITENGFSIQVNHKNGSVLNPSPSPAYCHLLAPSKLCKENFKYAFVQAAFHALGSYFLIKKTAFTPANIPRASLEYQLISITPTSSESGAADQQWQLKEENVDLRFYPFCHGIFGFFGLKSEKALKSFLKKRLSDGTISFENIPTKQPSRLPTVSIFNLAAAEPSITISNTII